MIKLEFVRFNTELNYDIVTICEGANVSGEFVANFSGYSLPGDIFTVNSLSVLFRSDGSDTSGGFEMKYTIMRSDSGKIHQVTHLAGRQGLLLFDADNDYPFCFDPPWGLVSNDLGGGRWEGWGGSEGAREGGRREGEGGREGEGRRG